MYFFKLYILYFTGPDPQIILQLDVGGRPMKTYMHIAECRKRASITLNNAIHYKLPMFPTLIIINAWIFSAAFVRSF